MAPTQSSLHFVLLICSPRQNVTPLEYTCPRERERKRGSSLPFPDASRREAFEMFAGYFLLSRLECDGNPEGMKGGAVLRTLNWGYCLFRQLRQVEFEAAVPVSIYTLRIDHCSGYFVELKNRKRFSVWFESPTKLDGFKYANSNGWTLKKVTAQET